MLGPSAHEDTFTRDNLPPRALWPDILLEGFPYPDHLNVAVELTDHMVEKGFGDHVALIGNGRQRTYKELSDWTSRLAHVLVEDHGLRPGERVLIRSANNPALVACWLAATKAGAVVVNTMPLLRAGELARIVDKAQIRLALCDTRLMDEITECAKSSQYLRTVIGFDGTAKFDISGEGCIMVDGSGARAGDEAADVTLTADADTFQQILQGDLDPTAAFMQGKLAVDGDMGAAMRLASVLA